ncbi:hypothetical protein MIND_01124100 [Mycena indigotica]|uniref:Uncharacterized protein n=1 Tax=Mycena indigotica TaxID=2126181 RepID=A0A8H6S5W8_9AGAR|nr:uncharacterized protein MIND_01124100 [Mycena indigotica]KAF7293464.1 hypothetical protein MIND_01124100 [Mycena indigotica]
MYLRNATNQQLDICLHLHSHLSRLPPHHPHRPRNQSEGVASYLLYREKQSGKRRMSEPVGFQATGAFGMRISPSHSRPCSRQHPSTGRGSQELAVLPLWHTSQCNWRLIRSKRQTSRGSCWPGTFRLTWQYPAQPLCSGQYFDQLSTDVDQQE